MVLGSGTAVAAVAAAGPGGAAGRPGQPSLALGRQMSRSATSTTGVRQGNERSGCIADLDRDLNTRERVGQLVWVGLAADQAPTGVDSVVTTNRLGGVVLLGGFHSGITATAKTTAHVHGLSDTRVRIAIAADQEGGYVQQCRGRG
jgi:beta-N-acetylhexosaminidase